MKKTKTPSFILELPLVVSKKQAKELLSRFESARNLYNACLGEAKRRVMLIKQSKLFQKARKLPRGSKERSETFKISRDKYDFNEYSLHSYIGKLRHMIPNNLDIQTTQKLATRAFRAAERILYGKARKVRFKGYNQLNSVESKSNATGIRWRNSQAEWNGLVLKPIIEIEDEVIRHGLQCKVKYCRIVRKIIRNKNLFYVQLVLEGKPFIKEKNKLGKDRVCFDLGPSTLAIVSKDNDNFQARLLQFCSELEVRAKEICNLQQKIDRERRQNNPQNYSSNGKIKKGRNKWKKSKRQILNEQKLREVNRITVEHRKSLQGKLVNEVLRMGNDFRTENVSVKWLQKNFGKSVGIRAPGQFVLRLERKAESAGAPFLKFPTQTTKLSQVCICGRQKKKSLSQRVQDCECGVLAQRDLFSAYLGLFVEKTEKAEKEEYVLQAGQALRAWPSADKLLQAAWRNSESASGELKPSSFGNFKNYQSQSGSFVKGGKEIIAKFKIQNVVFGKIIAEESLRANEAFPLEPTGFNP